MGNRVNINAKKKKREGEIEEILEENNVPLASVKTLAKLVLVL